LVELVGAIAIDAKVVEMPNQQLAAGDNGSKPRIVHCNGAFNRMGKRSKGVSDVLDLTR
jgi:hypothetical protein